MFPEKFTFRGLSQKDFNELRTKNEIKDIFKSVGVEYGKGKFEGVYMRAQSLVKYNFSFLNYFSVVEKEKYQLMPFYKQ